MHGVRENYIKRTREVPAQFRNDIPKDANIDEMSTLLQQLSYKYEADKFGESALDATKGNPANLPPHPSWRSRQRRLDILNTVPERDNNSKMQHLQQHEREQHIHQLQSINNLLLELPVPTSPIGSRSETLRAAPQPSKYQGDVAVGSPTSKGPGVSPNLEDTSISDLFGLGLPRGSLTAAGQKEQGGQSNFDCPSKLSYSNYPLMRDNSGTEYFSNTSSAEQHDNNSTGYYSNSTNMDVPNSPVLVHTPASPSTPGSLYSTAYSYSSAGSSPYTSSGSSVTNSYNKQSPVRSPCYGRAIRGSTPYSDCSSPSAELPPNLLNWNGSRSDSPADSENSVNSVDGPLSDFVNYLSLNAGQPCYYPTNPSTLLEVEKYFERKGKSSIEQKLKKYLENQQVPQVQQHFQHHHPHQNQQRIHYNQQNYNGSYINSNFESDKGCCVITRNTVPNQHPAHLSLDKAARYHRNRASVSDATYTWSGTLPLRTQNPFGYSSKVFLGGVPWDITESILISTFKQFGPIKIEWPGKNQTSSQPKGYVYIVFESEKQVKALLGCCVLDVSNGGSYYYKISSKRMKGKEVQVIPWALNDSNFVKSSSQKLDPEKTVFVGALHGMITAKGLAKVMNDLFDNVIYAGIDTDKHKYPIGSARVTFSSKYSFNKAINAAFLEVKTSKFTKKLQVDPYIEDAPCSSCYVQQGPYFCREKTCFKYYCHTCWQWVHNNESMSWHKPMSRGLKNNQMIGLNSNYGGCRSIMN